MNKIIVLVGRQKDGNVFRLKPSSIKELKKLHDLHNTVSSVFISFDTQQDFEEIHGFVWDHVLGLLTGLPKDQVNKYGFKVIDPNTDQILYNSVKQHV